MATFSIAAVAGEIEKTQWGDEFIGKEYRGYGAGTHYMVNHGVLPDMCILGEPTDMQTCPRRITARSGCAFPRSGNYVHTAFAVGKQNGKLHSPHARSSRLDLRMDSDVGSRRRATKAKQESSTSAGIRGGYPWRASRTPDRTDVFLDLRVPPNMPLQPQRGAPRKQLFLDLQKKFPTLRLGFRNLRLRSRRGNRARITSW